MRRYSALILVALVVVFAGASSDIWQDDFLGGGMGGDLMPTARNQAEQTAPIVSGRTISIAYGEVNGDSVYVEVSAEADTTVDWIVRATYTSQMRQLVEPATDYYTWKTAANGDYADTTSEAASISGVRIGLGPRCYHSDHLKVMVFAANAAREETTTVTLFNGYLDYPIPDAPANIAANGYKVAAHHSGGYRPEGRLDINDETVGIDEWGEPELLLTTGAWFWEGPDESASWKSWVHQARDTTGANLGPVVGFTNLYFRDTGDYFPNIRRAYEYLWHLENTVGNAIARSWQDSIPARRENIHGAITPNFLNDAVMDSLAAFLASEWNWSENRLYRVGQMWDVWEHHADFATSGDPQSESGTAESWVKAGSASFVMDYDRDGTAWIWDEDEALAVAEFRSEWLQTYRDALVANDPEFGAQFVLGINSVSARADTALLSKVDFLFVEDLMVPRDVGTGYEVYDASCDISAHYPWHEFVGDGFVRKICDDIWYNSNAWYSQGNLPRPAGFNSSVLNFADYMRTGSGGPYVMVEASGEVYDPDGDGAIASQVTSIHPRYIEALSLMADNVYPSWIQHAETYRRGYGHPSVEGYADLSGLGTATGPMEQVEAENDTTYWHWSREFTNGLAEILILKEHHFDFTADQTDAVADTTEVDQFEYKITVGGTVLRESDGWFAPTGDVTPPTLSGFAMAPTDSSGGYVVASATGIVSEAPAYVEVKARAVLDGTPDDLWSEITADGFSTLDTEIYATWTTAYLTGDLSAATDSLEMAMRVGDLNGNWSAWQYDAVAYERADPPVITITASDYDEATEFASVNASADSPLYWSRDISINGAAYHAEVTTDTTASLVELLYDTSALDEGDVIRFRLWGETTASAQADSVVQAVTVDRVPTPPTALAATGGDETATVTWTDPAIVDVDSASVYVGTATGGPYTLFASGLDITSETTDVTGLTNDTDYYFVLTATDDSAQESVYSSEASATPTASGGGDTTPPDAPTNLTATVGDFTAPDAPTGLTATVQEGS